MHFTNGERYEGMFFMEKMYGEGKFYTNNGDVITGFWKNNKLVLNII